MKMRKNGLLIVTVTMQYIINLHCHKAEETIVSQKNTYMLWKRRVQFKNRLYTIFSFHNFYIFFCLRIKRNIFLFLFKRSMLFSIENQQIYLKQ